MIPASDSNAPRKAESATAESAKDRLIVGFDVPDAAHALALADRLGGTCRWAKVGLELYLSAGNAIVEQLARRGFSIFLDLKLHDIPNTVAGAVRSAAASGASLLTVHALGGPAMLAAAVEAAAGTAHPPELLAVTVLTSMDAAQLRDIGIALSPAEEVQQLARTAYASDIRGLVCSPLETAALRQEFGPELRLVTPGIRPATADIGDQKRIATPANAIRAGTDMLVVGRPITQAPDPAKAASAILLEMAQAIGGC